MPNGCYDTEEWPVGSRGLKYAREYEHKGDRTGWVKNDDGTYSYLIRIVGDNYLRSQQTLTKKEYFKVILQGDKKGDDSE